MKEMKTSIHILNLLLLASLFLVACNLPTNMDPTTVPPPARAYIDIPYNNALLPLAPVRFIALGYDITNVTQFEFSVNGSVVNTSPPTSYMPTGPWPISYTARSTAKTAIFDENWNPPANGNYMLSVRALGVSGGWSDPVSVMITIGKKIYDKVPPIEATTLILHFPTDTPTAVPPAHQVIPQAIAHLNLNCHRGPDTAFESDGTLFKGTSARILAINPEKTWLQIENPQVKGNRCWVLRASVDTSGDMTTITTSNGPPLPAAKQPPINATVAPIPTAIPTTCRLVEHGVCIH